MKEKTKIIKEDVILVGFEDVVRLNFHDNEVIVAKILRVQKRFGCHNKGTTKVNDIVQYETICVEKTPGWMKKPRIPGEKFWADQGYIKEVLERNSSKIISYKYNPNPYQWKFLERTKGTFTNSLPTLIIELWNIYFGDTVCLDLKKAIKLYETHRNPGMVRKLFGWVIQVRRKAFLNWFLRNRNKFLRKYQEIHDEQTRMNKESEESYWKDVEDGFLC